MSDDDLIQKGHLDLIRRGDALYAIAGWEIPSTAIAALPAVTVGVKPLVWQRMPAGSAWDWQAWCDLMRGYYYAGTDAQKREHEAVRSVRILTALEPVAAPDPALRPTMTDMMVDPDTLDAFMEANPLPPDPAPAKQVTVSEAEAIREAALREARQRVNDLVAERQADLHGARNDFNRGAVDALQEACAAILALIQKGAADV